LVCKPDNYAEKLPWIVGELALGQLNADAFRTLQAGLGREYAPVVAALRTGFSRQENVAVEEPALTMPSDFAACFQKITDAAAQAAIAAIEETSQRYVELLEGRVEPGEVRPDPLLSAAFQPAASISSPAPGG
jgi:hypothetical protein